MVKVNKETCIGCGLCVSICPEVFEIKEDGKAEVKVGVDLEKNKKCIDEAIQSCSVNAIEK